MTEVLVEKVLLDNTSTGDVFARGVQVTLKDGSHRDILATKEVILAAGTIKTPQILELSGIGGAELLGSHGIDVVIDNPNVGENLQDHGYVPFSFEVADDQVSGDVLRDPEIASAAMAAYQDTKSGPLAGIPIVSSFMPLVDFTEDDMETLLCEYLDSVEYGDRIPSYRNQSRIISDMLKDPKDASGQYTMAPFQIVPGAGPHCKGLYGMSNEGKYISIVSVLNHPLSRGTVHINTTDPKAHPTIDPRYFSHPLDLELHARHALWIETIASTEPLASLLKKNGRRIHSKDIVSNLRSRATKKIVQECFVSHYHVVGTCSMMPEGLGGVVDERFLAHGVGNLRIVDASVFPSLPRGNIQTTVYAVAERAAEFILEDSHC